MKNFLIPIILIVSILLTSCQDKGETSLYLSGKENTLPDELKGLKVYSVSSIQPHTRWVNLKNRQLF